MNFAALKASWAAAAQLGGRAAEVFYATLFSLDPTLREMFPAVMGGQRGKLLAALGHIVSNVDDGDALVAFVKQLGADHRRFDVRPEHYPVVGQALLHTLATGLGDAWTAELQADWAEAYGIVSATMMQAAAEREQVEPPYWDAEITAHERGGGDVDDAGHLPVITREKSVVPRTSPPVERTSVRHNPSGTPDPGRLAVSCSQRR